MSVVSAPCVINPPAIALPAFAISEIAPPVIAHSIGGGVDRRDGNACLDRTPSGVWSAITQYAMTCKKFHLFHFHFIIILFCQLFIA